MHFCLDWESLGQDGVEHGWFLAVYSLAIEQRRSERQLNLRMVHISLQVGNEHGVKEGFGAQWLPEGLACTGTQQPTVVETNDER